MPSTTARSTWRKETRVYGGTREIFIRCLWDVLIKEEEKEEEVEKSEGEKRMKGEIDEKLIERETFASGEEIPIGTWSSSEGGRGLILN